MYRPAARAVPAADANQSKKTADIVTLIEFLLAYDTAGDPITGLKWSRRTTEKIAMALGDFGVRVSPNTVARLLPQMGYSLRVNHKKRSPDFSPDRNDQFLYLSDLRRRFQRRGLPIISVDTKKRELVGNFKNPGSRWDLSPRLVNDHDFRSDSTGVAIPYGIYALLANRGSVMVGVSHDTSAFAARAIAHWWRQEGATRYPRSRQLLILSDTGGSNGARRRTWKTELQSQLADSFGLTLTVAHYPTGASKWNPIEHRLFSEISKNWGRRTTRQLSEDPQIHPIHQNGNRLDGHRSTRPSQLSHWCGTDARTASIPSTETARDSPKVELHDLTQSVNLFLRQPLEDSR
jgi:hypothetical protein